MPMEVVREVEKVVEVPRIEVREKEIIREVIVEVEQVVEKVHPPHPESQSDV